MQVRTKGRAGFLALILACWMTPAPAETVSGQVTGWTKGEAEVFADSPGATPPTIGTVSADGAITLELPDAPRTPITVGSLPCVNNEGMSSSNLDTPLHALALLFGIKAPGAFSPDAVLGRVTLADSPEVAAWLANPMAAPAATGRFAMLVHVDGEASVQGDCEMDMSFLKKPSQTISIDYRFAPGWNVVLSEITAVSDDDVPAVIAQRQTTTSLGALDLEWRFVDP